MKLDIVQRDRTLNLVKFFILNSLSSSICIYHRHRSVCTFLRESRVGFKMLMMVVPYIHSSHVLMVLDVSWKKNVNFLHKFCSILRLLQNRWRWKLITIRNGSLTLPTHTHVMTFYLDFGLTLAYVRTHIFTPSSLAIFHLLYGEFSNNFLFRNKIWQEKSEREMDDGFDRYRIEFFKIFERFSAANVSFWVSQNDVFEEKLSKNLVPKLKIVNFASKKFKYFLPP